jgi:glycine cleavage system regulatory protein
MKRCAPAAGDRALPISIVLTVIGKDHPGLVRAISEKVAASGGNWLESRMARLAGEFAGIVLVSVDEAQAEGLVAALRALEAEGLRVTVERGVAGETVPAEKSLKLELVGHDHPGIVRDVAAALAGRGINIEELTTEVVSGSWSGDQLFRAHVRLRVPAGLALNELREALERLASDLIVDITLDEVGPEKN